MEIEYDGRLFTVEVESDRILEGDHVHACGFYERALIAALREREATNSDKLSS